MIELRSLASIPRAPLAHLPTPLETAPRLGASLGLRDLRIKRDDCTGLAMGGNKARKLEFLVADALEQGADTLITTGGTQSNHARMTAAAACKYGLRSALFLSTSGHHVEQGNLLLDRMFDAEVRFYPDHDYDRIEREMRAVAAEMRERGQRPYIIPVGGSTPLGCLGYVEAVREVASQGEACGWVPDVMVTAVGSCGTIAGLLLGSAVFLPGCRVIGVSVSRRGSAAAERAANIASEAAALLHLNPRFEASDLRIDDDWIGPGYGVATPEGDQAVLSAARAEGLILDPVYTGKAMAGLRGLAERGVITGGERVVFWHTGGGPALFGSPDIEVDRAVSNGEAATTAR
jgi:D-cysteine desulfhydrase family pyridoxal phosphate-dependent enzyme